MCAFLFLTARSQEMGRRDDNNMPINSVPWRNFSPSTLFLRRSAQYSRLIFSCFIITYDRRLAFNKQENFRNEIIGSIFFCWFIKLLLSKWVRKKQRNFFPCSQWKIRKWGRRNYCWSWKHVRWTTNFISENKKKVSMKSYFAFSPLSGACSNWVTWFMRFLCKLNYLLDVRFAGVILGFIGWKLLNRYFESNVECLRVFIILSGVFFCCENLFVNFLRAIQWFSSL